MKPNFYNDVTLRVVKLIDDFQRRDREMSASLPQSKMKVEANEEIKKCKDLLLETIGHLDDLSKILNK